MGDLTMEIEIVAASGLSLSLCLVEEERRKAGPSQSWGESADE